MANQFEVNLQLKTGSDFYQEFYLRNDDMSPIDLTGISFYATLQKHSRSVDANSVNSNRVYTKFNTQIVDASSGTYAITLGRTQSDTLQEGKYVYDVTMIDPQGHFTPVNSGLVFVDKGFGVAFEDIIIDGGHPGQEINPNEIVIDGGTPVTLGSGPDIDGGYPLGYL